MLIKRKIHQEIQRFLDKKEKHSNVLLLSGARQVGKSTLIKEVVKTNKAIFVNLYEKISFVEKLDRVESFTDLERLLFAELNFKPSEGKVLVFDEAQEAKNLGRWVRFFKENWSNQKVILLGSILSNLFGKDLPYPVGRVEEITLRPFSFREFLLATHRSGLCEILESASLKKPLTETERQSFIKPYLEYLQIGGMPAVVKNFVEMAGDVKNTWDQLVRQYALDVERYLKESYRSLFLSAMDRITDLTCYPIKNSQIISTDSPVYRRLPALLEILEKWHLVFKISAQTKHPESAGGLAGKRYLFDVGLANYLIHHSQPLIWQDRPEIGNLVYAKLQENYVCQEIIAAHLCPQVHLSYYRDTRNSQEIDFLLPVKGQLVPVEVKSQSSFSRNSLIPMINFLEQRNLPYGILVYNGPMKKISFRKKVIFTVPPFFVSELFKD